MTPRGPFRQRLAMVLQWVGLGAAALGLLVTPLLGMGLALQAIAGGAIAVALDVVAIRTASDGTAALAALTKLVVVIVALIVLLPSDAIPTSSGPIPADTGPILILLSVVPSAIGSLLRRPVQGRERNIPPGVPA